MSTLSQVQDSQKACCICGVRTRSHHPFSQRFYRNTPLFGPFAAKIASPCPNWAPTLLAAISRQPRGFPTRHFCVLPCAMTPAALPSAALRQCAGGDGQTRAGWMAPKRKITLPAWPRRDCRLCRVLTKGADAPSSQHENHVLSEIYTALTQLDARSAGRIARTFRSRTKAAFSVTPPRTVGRGGDIVRIRSARSRSPGPCRPRRTS